MQGPNAYELAIVAAAFVAVVGIIVLGLGLPALVRWLLQQPEREIRYLTEWWMFDDDDESLVGVAHAYRSGTRYTPSSEPPSAAGQGDRDGPPPRSDDAFESFSGTIDEFLAAERSA